MTSKEVGGGASILSGSKWNQLPAGDPSAWLGRQNGSGKVSYFPLEPGSKNQLGCPPPVAVTGQGQAVGL